MARPLFVAILERKPCVLLRFKVLGWKVRFIFSPINSFDQINLKKETFSRVCKGTFFAFISQSKIIKKRINTTIFLYF